MINRAINRTINRPYYNAIKNTPERSMSHITANELKTRGVAAIEAQLADGRTEAVLSVRGTDRYVVMALAQYQHLRECELEAALAESRADMAAGRYVIETAEQHVTRVQALIAADKPAAAKAPAKAAKPALASFAANRARSRTEGR